MPPTIIVEWQARNQAVTRWRKMRRFQRNQILWAAVVAVILLLASTGVRKAIAQMVSTGAKDRPGLPLPPGMMPPVADFRDLAGEAGLKAVVVSGEFKQNYLV